MSHRVAVYLVLGRDGHVLFMRRAGTGYRDGEYGLPSGKVDPGELITDAIVREAREEIGIEVDPTTLDMVHVAERNTPTGNWLDFYFTCPSWDGEPGNAEPHKCSEVAWLEPDAAGVIDYIVDVLSLMAAGVSFSTWKGE